MRIALVVCSLIIVLISAHRRGHLSKDKKDKLAKDLKIGDLDKWKERLDKIRVNMKDMSESEKAELRKKIKNIRKVKRNERKNATSPLEVNEEEGVAEYLYQGDILLTEDQLKEKEQSNRSKRQTSGVAARWPNRTVTYYFDSFFNAGIKDIVWKSIKLLVDNTCVNFIEDPGLVDGKHQVWVHHGRGCFSMVGMIKYYSDWDQPLSLGNGCFSSGTIIHEFMHAVGIHHTQSRPDRDHYVHLDVAKVNQTYLHNYNIESGINSTVPYELGSVMHYSTNSFSTPENVEAMIPHNIDYLYTMGSSLVSFNDYKMINDMYNCHDQCTPVSSAKCQNGGYPNPRNCALCNCPSGFTGPLCDQKPAGCGQQLQASPEWQSAEINGSETIRPDQPEFTQCVSWINAPNGTKVEIKITSMDNTHCHYGCTLNGFEIKTELDQTTGQRYCCSEFVGSNVTSLLNPTPVIAYNKWYTPRMTFQYRYVSSQTNTSCVVEKKELVKKVWNGTDLRMKRISCNILVYQRSEPCYFDGCGPVKYPNLPINYTCNLHFDQEFQRVMSKVNNYTAVAQILGEFERKGTNATMPPRMSLMERDSKQFMNDDNVHVMVTQLVAWEQDGILFNCTTDKHPMACQLFNDFKTRRGIILTKSFDGANLV